MDMKKYRRKVLLFSLKKLFIIAFLLVGIVILGFISSGEFNAVCIIFSGIAVTLLFHGLFAKLGVAGRYTSTVPRNDCSRTLRNNLFSIQIIRRTQCQDITKIV